MALFVGITLTLALYDCAGTPGSPMSHPLNAAQGRNKFAVPARTSSGFLYYLLQVGSPIRKVRLGDGKTFNHKSYGVSGGVRLTIDVRGHLYEASRSGQNSAVTELNKKLVVVRTITMPDGIATAVAVDRQGLAYVAWIPNNHEIAIDVFSRDASGNATPIRSITGINTGLQFPIGVGVDGTGKVYVADALANQILVYAARANGDVAPVQVIGGSQTGLTSMCNLSLGADGNLYVSNQFSGSAGGYDVLVFPMSGSGNIAPLRTLQTGPYGYAITLDTTGQLYAGLGFEGGPGEPVFEIFAAGASGQDQPIGSVDGIKGATPASAVLEFPWYQP
jgi:hypothetical protein